MTDRPAWEWDSGCCVHADLRCHGSTAIRLDGGRLVYEGFCADASFGGGYAIGSQSLADFLATGPLDVRAPAALLDEIRTHLTAPEPPKETETPKEI